MSNNSLSFTERLGYGLGDTASNFFFQTFIIFLLYYYTDVFGLSAAAVGTMFFVSRLWDAVNDPLMGMVADRTNTRYGKFRPYLLWVAVPYGIMGCLVFAGPDWSDTGKLIYAWVTYTLMMMLYTAINVPYSALMGVMTPVSKERTILASFRFVGAYGGGLLLISALVRPMVQFFGAEDEATGFRITMAIFAVASILMFWFTFATTRERVVAPQGENVSLARDLKILLANRPWIVLCFAGILTLASIALKTAVTLYYFKYYVQDDGTKILLWDSAGFFLFSGPIFLIVGVCCTKLLTDRFEKKTLLIALSLVNAVLTAFLFIVPPEQYWLMVVVNCVASLVAGPTAPLVWSMYGDVADYGEWRFGRRTTGLVFSASMFAQKFGLAIGAGLSGWILAYFGYVANEVQTDASVLGIRLLFTLFPAMIALLNVVALCFYQLPDGQVAQIERELAARRDGGAAEPAT